MNKLKNLVESYNRLDQAEERISELEERPFEIIWQRRKKEKKRMNKFNKAPLLSVKEQM